MNKIIETLILVTLIVGGTFLMALGIMLWTMELTISAFLASAGFTGVGLFMVLLGKLALSIGGKR